MSSAFQNPRNTALVAKPHPRALSAGLGVVLFPSRIPHPCSLVLRCPAHVGRVLTLPRETLRNVAWEPEALRGLLPVSRGGKLKVVPDHAPALSPEEKTLRRRPCSGSRESEGALHCSEGAAQAPRSPSLVQRDRPPLPRRRGRDAGGCSLCLERTPPIWVDDRVHALNSKTKVPPRKSKDVTVFRMLLTNPLELPLRSWRMNLWSSGQNF